jgi:hypothetical protein
MYVEHKHPQERVEEPNSFGLSSAAGVIGPLPVRVYVLELGVCACLTVSTWSCPIIYIGASITGLVDAKTKIQAGHCSHRRWKAQRKR